MRVIAGSCRGRPLRAPEGGRTRPTADRVREAVFDVLGSILGPSGLRGAAVVDLFAGSGALGIEAMSRGARTAVFVDRDRRAVATIRRNLADLGLQDGSQVVQAEVLGWLAGAPGPFDLAFCDPPYAFDDWPALLTGLRADLVVAESDRPPTVPDGWDVLKRKRYGSTLVTVATCTSTAAGSSGPSPAGDRAIGDAGAVLPPGPPGRQGPAGSEKGVQ